ncbi:MAG: hypothetical protein DIU78_015120 [Pseudomonadota bacterium]
MGNALGGGMHLAIPFDRLLGVRAIPVAALAGPVAGARVQRLDPATRRALERTRLARAVVRAALRARDADGEARRLDGLSARARLAAGLPDLVLRAARSTDASLRVSPTDTEVYAYDYTRTGKADLLLEARVSFDLHRLLFAPEEIAIERLRLERARERERLIERVLGHLLAWERGKVRLLDPELDAEARRKGEAEVTAAALALEALTDGEFSAELARGAFDGGAAPSAR